MSEQVRVRYAPSPTGYQHIGGIRTALFNFLFARVNNGKFILRIEDTDRSRFFDGALQDIFETFEWLGIEYDEGPEKGGPYAPYFQSERQNIHQKYAEELINKGWAYYCFCDSERLSALREQQEANKQQIGYDRHCRNLSDAEINRLKEKGINPVIRFKAPVDGKTSFTDKLFGTIEVENKTLQDFILLKSDGFPTYHLANIVDDHLMQISHVLRAQEWIPSTPNHVLLYKAFGWEPPEFCHLPMVMGEDGKKLSKRHGATQVNQFKKDGYLPEAIVNFISLLGWAYNDSEELFTMDRLTEIFNINKINKSPAIFNYQKLKWFNGIYIRQMTVDRLTDILLPYYIKDGLVNKNPDEKELNYLKKIIPLVQERIELITEAPSISDFMFGEFPEYRTWNKIFPKKTDKNTLIEILKDAAEILKKLDEKPAEELKQSIYDLTKKYNVKAGDVFMPIRIAVTGTNKSPDLFPVLDILGAEKVIKRIENAIQKIINE